MAIDNRIRFLIQTRDPFAVIHGGNGLEASQEDESVEETYFRLIIESPYFDNMNPEDREMFLLELSQQCITWVQERHNY